MTTIIDTVDKAFHELYDGNKQFKALVSAVDDEHSVEGTLATDDIRAAKMIREHATELAGQKIEAVRSAMHTVMRRHAIRRPNGRKDHE